MLPPIGPSRFVTAVNPSTDIDVAETKNLPKFVNPPLRRPNFCWKSMRERAVSRIPLSGEGKIRSFWRV